VKNTIRDHPHYAVFSDFKYPLHVDVYSMKISWYVYPLLAGAHRLTAVFSGGDTYADEAVAMT
jgi:hypothetical protein